MFCLQILSDNVIIGLLGTLTVSLVGAITGIIVWVFNSLKKDLKTEIDESKNVLERFVDALNKKLEKTDDKIIDMEKMLVLHSEKLKKK